MPRVRSLATLLAVGSAASLLAGVVLAPPAGAASGSSAQACSQSFLPLPDPACTPGVKNPDVTQSTIDSTICVSGWTATVRPPTSYTNPLKAQQIAEYGYSDTSLSSYEEDHMLPLELGGSPRDPQNLWPEPHNAPAGESAASKDTIENKLKALVCNGTSTLVTAQDALLSDWRTAVAVASGSGPSAGAVPRRSISRASRPRRT